MYDPLIYLYLQVLSFLTSTEERNQRVMNNVLEVHENSKMVLFPPLFPLHTIVLLYCVDLKDLLDAISFKLDQSESIAFLFP